MSIAQHPTMVMQAYKLAAKGLAEEIQKFILTAGPKRISDLSTGLDSCLQELQGLRSTLVMCPATEWDDGNVKLREQSWIHSNSDSPSTRK